VIHCRQAHIFGGSSGGGRDVRRWKMSKGRTEVFAAMENGMCRRKKSSAE
jgi:hypothetical protein